jgi:hypothetical protein
MTTLDGGRRGSGPAGAESNGWLAFAGIVLFLNGIFAALYGLTAILNDEVITVGGRGVVVWDFTHWGWIQMIAGVVMALTAVGLFMGTTAARWLAVAIVTFHATLQFVFISAFPLWAILSIVLDVVILYQLLARWQPTR